MLVDLMLKICNFYVKIIKRLAKILLGIDLDNAPVIKRNYSKKIIDDIDYSKYYKKEYVMTQTELTFYRNLKTITDELDLTIFPQVDLERIINVKNNINAYRNRIKSRSIDYTIVNNKNCKIICCIELDDYTHNNPERIKRDIFINNLFNNVGLKLYRYNLNTNINIIKNNLKQESII